MSPDPKPRRKISLLRLALVLVPLTIAVVAVSQFLIQNYETTAREQSERVRLRNFDLDRPIENRLSERFTDADGDYVADPPTAAELVDPERLTFCYIPETDVARVKAAWQPLVDHLAVATGKPVDYLEIDSTTTQLQALKSGELHLAGLNTGSVPIAVDDAGFVPVSTLGHADGTYGYRMQIIVPAGSKIKSVADLAGEKIVFTDKQSNSGFKAAVVLLRSDFGLEPDRDYQYGFSYGHQESIAGVAAGRYRAATIASDVLAKMQQSGDADTAKIRVVFESEQFPPAALGYSHRLVPELAAKVREALTSFQIAGTSLEAELTPSGITQFVPVSYKDDWAVIRRIDNLMGTEHKIADADQASASQ